MPGVAIVTPAIGEYSHLLKEIRFSQENLLILLKKVTIVPTVVPATIVATVSNLFFRWVYISLEQIRKSLKGGLFYMSRKMYKTAKWMSITGMCILFISAFINFWWGKADMQSINTQFGFTLVAIGLAAYAISLAFSSEEKMIALTNLNFTEKHAMMQTYIQDFKRQDYNRAEQCKLDFEATIEVKKWASTEKKEEYIEDLIKLINTRLRTHVQEENIQTVEDILISMIDKAIASKMTTKTQTTTLTELEEDLSKHKKKIS